MSSEKNPLGVTFGSLGVLGPLAVTEIAQIAQSLDYKSFWTVEATGTDAFTLLGSVANAVSPMDLGTGIIPIQIRTPALTAMTAATLQSLAPTQNIWLGIGTSAPGILSQHGLEKTDRPIAMMREYVALLRACFSGESVTFEGDFWQVKRFRLGLKKTEREPKIVLAALNPQMLKLAGEIADGVLLNYIPASYISTAIKEVRSGGPATIMSYVHAAVGDFEQSATSARKDLFNYAMAEGYARMFKSAGFETEIQELRLKQSERDRDGALAAISENMIQSIDFIGNSKEVTQFVQSYIEAGVEYPILMPLPWGENRHSVAVQTMEAAANATQA